MTNFLFDDAASALTDRVPGEFGQVQAVADAVLYEGYVLYPYRKSSTKNRVRWQFGVLAPRSWIEAAGPITDSVAGSTESWWQQTECLVEAPDSAVVTVRARFLQTSTKSLEARDTDGRFHRVEQLDLGDRVEVAFDEAIPRETDCAVRLADLLAAERAFGIDIPAETTSVAARHDDGRETGRTTYTSKSLHGLVRISAERVPAAFPVARLRIRIENAEEDTDPRLSREQALRHAMVSTHCLVAISGGTFLSLLDPPEWAADAAKACSNVRTFPVLAGPVGSAALILSAPIILYDHPQVAPESPGDLHDATEIDEILSLRALTLTEDEKREARGTDPRVAAIVDRVETMPPEVMERLHGAVRSLRPAQSSVDRPDSERWWEPGADSSVSPATDEVLVEGVRVRRGSRVRLDPGRRRADAHDMFLAGRTARVEAVLLDVDGSRQIAVTIEDDPSAELHQWYGRFHHFRPEEIHPLPDGTGTESS